MREKIVRLIEVFDPKRFVKFGLIGVLNTLVDFCVFFLMDRWVIGAGPTLALLGMTVVAGPYISNAVAYVVANINSFVWNKLWTFEKRDRVTGGEAGRYLATSAGYVLISTVSLAVCIRILSLPVIAPLVPEGWTNLLAKLPTACVTIFYNYLMNKFWVFKA